LELPNKKLEREAANANIATALGSIPESSVTLDGIPGAADEAVLNPVQQQIKTKNHLLNH